MSNQEIKETRLTIIRKKYDERAYVVTILGQDHVFAHVDIHYLLNLIDQQAKEIKDVSFFKELHLAQLGKQNEYIEKTESSLELAVNALKEIHESDIPAEDGFDYVEYYYKVSEITEKFIQVRGKET